MEFVHRLNVETDYTVMCGILVQCSNASAVTQMFEGYNTRIALSSFMVKNFASMFPRDLVSHGTVLANNISSNNFVSFEKDYNIFKKVFFEWKQEDIQNIRDQISSTVESVEAMTIDSPRDEADRQWNEGVALNLENLEKSRDTLKLLAPSLESP